jgi:hypothetical protein
MVDDRRTRIVIRGARASACALLILLLDACGSNTITQPSAPAPAPADGVQVQGTERLGWSQHASASEISSFRYLAYVDGVQAALSNASCSRESDTSYACVSPLPPLTSGRHVIQLTTVNSIGGGESARSSALVVVMNGRTT